MTSPKVSPPRTIEDVDLDILKQTRLRDLGRLRGEVRPLGRLIDDLLEERHALKVAAEAQS